MEPRKFAILHFTHHPKKIRNSNLSKSDWPKKICNLTYTPRKFANLTLVKSGIDPRKFAILTLVRKWQTQRNSQFYSYPKKIRISDLSKNGRPKKIRNFTPTPIKFAILTYPKKICSSDPMKIRKFSLKPLRRGASPPTNSCELLPHKNSQIEPYYNLYY